MYDGRDILIPKKRKMIISQLLQALSSALKDLYSFEIEADKLSIQPTRKEFAGSYTFVTFPYLRQSKTSPEETGEQIGEYLLRKEAIKGFNVVKGFLNLEISDETWIGAFNQLAEKGISKKEANGRKIMVEYSSPNTNKPLHLGHLRNVFLGYSVARIYEMQGFDVIKVQIINDRGIHICKSMVAWKNFGDGETPQSTGLKGDKLVGKYYVRFDKEYKQQVAQLVSDGTDQKQAEKQAPIMLEAHEMLRKWEIKDPETYSLWETMNSWVYDGFDKTYSQMGVDFDKLYYESNTYLLGKKMIAEGLEKGTFYQKDDGSVWVDLTDDGLDEKLLLRSDGTAVYMTQDIGTAIERFKEYEGLEKLVYTVGNEQDYHFKVLFLILKKLGYDWANGCYHLSYGMVDLPSGKMKSREGTVVDADDLMDEMVETAKRHTIELGKIEGFSEEQANELYQTVGLGALKYFLLKVDPKKRMLFDPEESIQFHGNTGPFIQYTHARICAILRKGEEMNLSPSERVVTVSLHNREIEVIRLLTQFQDKIDEAAHDYSPSLVAQYIFDLAKEYNKFYQEVPIFGEADENKLKLRLNLSRMVAATIKSGMGLLGINVPNRM